MRPRDPDILASAPWWRILILLVLSAALAGIAVRETSRNPGDPLDHLSHFVPIFLLLFMSWSEAERLWRYRKECQKVLPAFAGKAVSSLPAESVEGLRASLVRLGFVVVDLDGRKVTDLTSLVDAVGKMLGPIQYPEEPRARLRALLGFEARDNVRNKAVFWHDAHVLAGNDPATFAWFLGEWRRMAAKRTTVRLLFVDAPPAVLEAAGELLALTPNQGARP
jgi:hypothetical protein